MFKKEAAFLESWFFPSQSQFFESFYLTNGHKHRLHLIII